MMAGPKMDIVLGVKSWKIADGKTVITISTVDGGGQTRTRTLTVTVTDAELLANRLMAEIDRLLATSLIAEVDGEGVRP